jgi:hypothetical protein
VKTNENPTTTKKRKRSFSNSTQEPKTKRRLTSAKVLDHEQVEILIEELEKEHRVSGDVLEQAIKEMERLTKVKTFERLRRSHKPLIPSPATQQTSERKEVRNDLKPSGLQGKTVVTEEELKQEKKSLREKIVNGQTELDKLEEEVKRWLKTIPHQELELEDGKLFLQEVQTRPKMTKTTVMEGFSEAFASRGNLKEGQAVMALVRSGLEQMVRK